MRFHFWQFAKLVCDNLLVQSYDPRMKVCLIERALAIRVKDTVINSIIYQRNIGEIGQNCGLALALFVELETFSGFRPETTFRRA